MRRQFIFIRILSDSLFLFQFINGGALDSVKDHVRVNIRPLLLQLGDFRSLNMNVLKVLTVYICQEFSSAFSQLRYPATFPVFYG